MGAWAVSPRFAAGKLQGAPTLEDKIDVFEDQVTGWVLNHASALDAGNYALREHSGIAILMLVTPYFEQIASYLRGEDSNGHSGEFFRHGVRAVFPNMDDQFRTQGVRDPAAAAEAVMGVLYSEVRCGLFHEAMIRGRILIRRDTASLGVMIERDTGEIGAVVVDPFLLLGNVRAHFEGYICRLRDPAEHELRRNFEAFWNIRMARPAAVLPPPVPPAAAAP